MPTLVPSWNTKRVFATWLKQAGLEMRAGTYKVTVPVRVTNATDDVIIPAGTYASGSLNVTSGTPSLDVQIPCTNDPDNSPNGWQVQIDITFTDAAGEKYLLDVPIVGGDINLRTVVLTASIPAPVPVLIRGVAGGIAELDADGDVTDAAGAKVLPSSGTALTSYATQVAPLVDYPATFPPAIGATASTAVAGNDARLTNARTPTAHTHLAADVSNSTATGRALITATDAAAARTAIGAGTSSLAIGTTGTTAAAGNDSRLSDARAPLNHSAATITSGLLDIARVPAGTIVESTSTTVRPTARTDVHVYFSTATDPSAAMLTGDKWLRTT